MTPLCKVQLHPQILFINLPFWRYSIRNSTIWSVKECIFIISFSYAFLMDSSITHIVFCIFLRGNLTFKIGLELIT